MEKWVWIVALVPLGYLGYKFAWAIVRDLARHKHDQRMMELEERDAETAISRSALVAFNRDSRGSLPLMYDSVDRVFRDGETLRSFSMTVINELRPELERLWATVRTVQDTTPPPNLSVGEVETMLSPALPRIVRAVDLFDTEAPSLLALPIGVTINDDGQEETVYRSLYQMMHTIVIGRTDAGKSTWLLSFLASVIMSGEPVEVVAIDVSGSAFNILSGWGKLRYPVARTVPEAIGLLGKIEEERKRRIELYEHEPMASDLRSYNQASNEPLVPWIVLIDEGVLLLSQKGVGDIVRNLALGTRQYGIYAIITGHSANASVFDTVVRGSFVTRLGFTTEKGTLRTLFDEPVPDLENVPGRMWARLDGEMVKMQGPYISKPDFMRVLQTDRGKPKYSEIPGATDTLTEDEQDQMIERLLDERMPAYKVEQAVFGYKGGTAHRRVHEIIDRRGQDISTDQNGSGDAVCHADLGSG